MLKVCNLADDRVLKWQFAPIRAGSHSACELKLDGDELFFWAFLHKEEGRVYLSPGLVADVWMCLEDIGSSIPLKDGMMLRMGNMREEPNFQISISLQGLEVVKDFLGSRTSLGKYEGDFAIGRGPKASKGYERCAAGREHKTIPTVHAAIRRRGDSWFLEAHPDAKKDEDRSRSTWLRLSSGTAYLLPPGSRDGFTAIHTGSHTVKISVPSSEATTLSYKLAALD